MRTRHTAALSLCILLAGLALAVAETQLDGGNKKGSATTWLADVLTPGAKAMYAEEETACLRFLQGTNCTCLSPPLPLETCRHQFQTNDFGCCHDDHAGERSFLESPPTAASCAWDVQGPDVPIVVAPNIKIVGDATFMCKLNRNADECGSPLCDGMKIRGSGKVYRINNTAAAPLYTRGPAAPYIGVSPPGCGAAFPRVASMKAETAANRPQASAEADAAGYYRGEPDFTAYYPLDSMDVFVGTFEAVVGPRHRGRPLTGRVQFTATFNGSTVGAPPVYTLPAGGMAFDPWAMTLKFDAREHY